MQRYPLFTIMAKLYSLVMVTGDLGQAVEGAFHGCPGIHLMAALKEAAAAGAATALASSTWIAQALRSRSFRQKASDWSLHGEERWCS